MSELSIEEAAELIGKSKATVLRYKRNGVDVTNREELAKYSHCKTRKRVERLFTSMLVRPTLPNLAHFRKRERQEQQRLLNACRTLK